MKILIEYNFELNSDAEGYSGSFELNPEEMSFERILFEAGTRMFDWGTWEEFGIAMPPLVHIINMVHNHKGVDEIANTAEYHLYYAESAQHQPFPETLTFISVRWNKRNTKHEMFPQKGE